MAQLPMLAQYAEALSDDAELLCNPHTSMLLMLQGVRKSSTGNNQSVALFEGRHPRPHCELAKQ